MKNIFFLICILAYYSMTAQYDVNAVNNDLWHQASGIKLAKNDAYNKVEGSLMLFDKLGLPAKITLNDGKEYKLTNMDYNIKSDQMQVLISADSVFSFQSKNIAKVRIANANFITYFDSELSRNIYYEEIAKSKGVNLWKRYSLKIKEGIRNPLTKQMQSPDKFVITSNYYIFKDDKLEELKLKKKSLAKLFGEHWDKIASFIDENDLSYKDEYDLKKIFTYNNTL